MQARRVRHMFIMSSFALATTVGCGSSKSGSRERAATAAPVASTAPVVSSTTPPVVTPPVVTPPVVRGPGTWVDLAAPTLPTALAGCSCATVNDKIYIFGGNTAVGGVVNTIYELDPATGTLTLEPTVLPQVMSDPVAAVVGAEIYLLGGSTVGQLYDVVWAYDPATSTIRTLPPMPIKANGMAAAAGGGNLYVFGGHVQQGSAPPVVAANTAAIQRYSPTTRSWVTLPLRLPRPTSTFQAFTVGGTIYLVGGGEIETDQRVPEARFVTNYDAVLAFDFATETIRAVAPLPVATKGAAGGVLNGRIVVAGGDRSLGSFGPGRAMNLLVRDVYEYDPVADSWRALTQLSTVVPVLGTLGGRYAGGAAVAAGKLYLVGGLALPPNAPNPPTRNEHLSIISAFTP